MLIDNSNLLRMCNDCGAVGFVPVLTYVYDAAAATVTVTNASTIPAGDTLNKVKVRVHDFFGHEIRGVITGAPVVIDVSTLDRSKSLAITATIITNANIVADGSAGGQYASIQAAGNIGFYDIQKNATA